MTSRIQATTEEVTVLVRDALALIETIECADGDAPINDVVDDFNRVYLTVNGQVFRITIERA
jgi:hypothetical protein